MRKQPGEVSGLLRCAAKNPVRCLVSGENQSVPRDSDHAGRNTFQYGFGESMFLIQLEMSQLQAVARLLQRGAASSKLLRHFVEGLDQDSQFIRRFRMDPIGQVAT